jgi:hypothetical protein
MALTTADLVFMTLTHVPLVDVQRNPFMPSSPALALVRHDPDRFRVLSYRVPPEPPVLPVNTLTSYGLETADGYDDVSPANLSRIMTWSSTACGVEICATPGGTDLANVKYIVAGPHTRLPGDRFDQVYDGEVRIFRSRGVLDRAFWVSDFAIVPDTATAIARARDSAFDPRRLVLVDQAPSPEVHGRDASARVSIVADTATGSEVHVEADGAGLLVLSETYYPGWRAQIDGRDVPILRANGVMRAVAVGAGSHEVSFRYDPDSFRLGAGLSAGSLVMALVALSFGVWRRGSR